MSTTSANDSSPQGSEPGQKDPQYRVELPTDEVTISGPPLLPAFSKSARYYNALYDNKDYPAEAAVYDSFLSPARLPGLRPSLLEFGCGTGGFSRHLNALGWSVTGVDASTEMINIANSQWLVARQGDISSDLLFAKGPYSHRQPALPPIRWNAVCAPFAVLSYSCLTPESFSQTLRNARKAVDVGGRFVFDVTHYAAAVASLRPFETRTAAVDGKVIRREMRKTFDLASSVVNYEMTFTVIGGEGDCEDCWREEHRLRAFTVQELFFALKENYFRPVFSGNMAGSPEVTADDWHILLAAEATD